MRYNCCMCYRQRVPYEEAYKLIYKPLLNLPTNHYTCRPCMAKLISSIEVFRSYNLENIIHVAVNERYEAGIERERAAEQVTRL